MSNEKALTFLNNCEFKNSFIKGLVSNFSTLGFAPEEAWEEFFSGLDYEEFIDGLAKHYTATFTEEELDDLIIFSKSPVFQKYQEYSTRASKDLYNVVDIWLSAITNSDLDRLSEILRKHKIDEDTIETLVSSMLKSVPTPSLKKYEN